MPLRDLPIYQKVMDLIDESGPAIEGLFKQGVDVTMTAQYPNDHNSVRNLFVENQIIADWKAAQSRAELIAKAPNAWELASVFSLRWKANIVWRFERT